MPIKIEKTLNESKHQTSIGTYVSGAAVAPTTQHVAIYTDIATADQHRLLEVQERLYELADRMREEGYRMPSSGVIYWVVPLGGPKAAIFTPLLSTDIVEGMVAIGLSGTVRGSGRGSLLFDACIKEMIDWANEQDRLVS